MSLSRRAFVRLGAAGAAAMPFAFKNAPAAAVAPTAQMVVDRIRQNVGGDWSANTVDTFKAGDPATPVTGIATTSLATVDVMRRALQAGANLIVTSGPTFFSRADSPTPTGRRGAAPVADPVFAAKQKFIADNRLVVWRLSDHWRSRTPDPFALGIAEALGWERYLQKGDAQRLTLPPTTLDALARSVKAKLNARGGIRVIGKPDARVRSIAIHAATIPIQTTLAAFRDADVIIAGEIREWESSEFARDLVHAGRNKGLILVGRSLSEEAGMNVCAKWLKAIVPDAPVRWIPAGDPYWRPTT